MPNFVTNTFELNNLVIFSHDRKKSISLYNSWVGIILQEDIYSNSISGVISIIDSVDLYNTFPFIGEEYIYLSYTVPELKETAELTLAVNSITSPVSDPSQKTKALSFSVVSPESIVNASTSVSKATQNQTVQTTVTELLEADIETSKTLICSDSTNRINAVIPGWRPFDVIKFLRKRAVSTDESDKSPWLFYERLDDTYVFDTIKNIIAKGLGSYNEDEHLITKESITDVDGDNVNNINPYNNIRRISFESNMNKMGQLAEGELRSETTQVDLLNKTFKVFDFKYDEQFSDLANPKMSVYKEFSDSYVKTNTKDAGADFLLHSDFSYNDDTEKNDVLGVQLGAKVAFLNSLDKGSITIELPGSPNWVCGTVVKLELYKNTGLEKPVYEKDERLDGFYCIEGVKHEFTRKEMLTNIRLFSIGSKLDIEKALESR